MDDEVAQFLSITGVDSEHVARGYLQITGGDLMQAVQLFFESPDLQASFTAPQAPTATASTAQGGARGRIGREDSDGVVHIDSDDDEDSPMSQGEEDMGDQFNFNDDDDGGRPDISAVARAAQEEEDAAMARRLQEDMYTQNPGSQNPEDVRAPMARTTETLVGGAPNWGADDDEHDALLEQIRQRRRAPGPNRAPPNPFHQSVWDDPPAVAPGTPPVPVATRPGGPTDSTVPRSQRLADMFRPPFDLIARFSWEEARQEGKDMKKWILVNVQDQSVFQCQALNRDHWKDENLKALIHEHFIFLQYDKDGPLSQDYINFYFSHQSQDPNNYPYVSIIDPRTGEQVKVWSGQPFPDQRELHSDLVEFLDRYSLAANSKNPVPTAKPKAKNVDVDRMTEEEMLEMALKNSLDAAGGSAGPNVHDPDELTKPNPQPEEGKGKERAVDEPDTRPASIFSQISPSNPHVEPGASATVTRIQFRHPAGRIIRRFAVTDQVRRIYEWLKAEPLEGREGLTFELKAQPGGDLIEKLDATIEEAGLKMGTVMIEFVQDE